MRVKQLKYESLMKTFLFIFLTALAASSLYAQDFVARAPRVPQPEKKAPKATEQSLSEGSIQHAAHFRNPLEIVNPLAPAEYGSGRQYVYYDESDPGQRPVGRKENPKGIKLFTFVF